MEETQVSLTAQLTAFVRGHHALHAKPKIFNDFLALDLLAAEQLQQIRTNLPQLLPLVDPGRAATLPDPDTALDLVIGTMMSDTLSRSCYAEDQLSLAIEDDAEQYVVLGAGMDTFAFRRGELLDTLSVFEVDHPATQRFKRNRIAELGWAVPNRLHYVPLDFARENLAEKLPQSGYDPHTLSFFSWLGVTLYLSREAVVSTLRDIATLSPSGSTIVFDYMDTNAFTPGRAAKRMLLLQNIVQQVGEPLQVGFDPDTLGNELEGVGLRLQDNLSPRDIEERYFSGRSDNYHASEHLHYARAVVK